MNQKIARPFRNSGVAYIPKKNKVELGIQVKVCNYLRKNYPDVIFHSDYAANADLSEHQKKVNKSLQSRYAFPDLMIFEPRGEYIGLALELKREGATVVLKIGPNKGQLTSNEHIQNQAVTLRKLKKAGWWANFSIGYEQTIKIIDRYFGNDQQSLF